jgi:hypothetical protein
MATKQIRLPACQESPEADSIPNPRWESFAQHRAAGASMTDAYLAAGYKASRESASSRSTRLAKQPWVRKRVADLLAARQRSLHGWDAATAGLATAPLEDAQWERFAQHLAAGAKQTDAYLAAGYKAARSTAWSAAAQLAKKPDIQRRVEDLLRARLSIRQGLDAKTEAVAAQPLKKAQWEVFSQDLAAGVAQTDAFIAAGYKGGKSGGWSRAGAVARRECVRERVTALHAEQLRHLSEERKKEGQEKLDAAMRERRFGPASRALNQIVKKSGF